MTIETFLENWANSPEKDEFCPPDWEARGLKMRAGNGKFRIIDILLSIKIKNQIYK